MFDVILGVCLIALVIRGYLRGGIRALFTLFALVGAYFVSLLAPHLFWFVTRYFYWTGDPVQPIASQLILYVVAFCALQFCGFVATGMLESVGLSSLNKLSGAALGIVAGVFLGCVPLLIAYHNPRAYYQPEVMANVRASFFMRSYEPMVRHFIKPPAKPKGKAWIMPSGNFIEN
jgi:uncharacterized membrane protein required for colicin V production